MSFTKLTDKIYFVSGIDTDAGKTVATGWLARELMRIGRRVATLKLVQTGAKGVSPDIALHRRIMQCALPEDDDGTTAPEIYTYPASPHLAAEIDKRPINFAHIDEAVQTLAKAYDVLLIEGAGGLMVPLTRHLSTIDYVKVAGWPVLFVGSGKLGAINHAVLSLEALERRRMPLAAFVWNRWFDGADPLIAADGRDYLKTYVSKHAPQALWFDCPVIDL